MVESKLSELVQVDIVNIGRAGCELRKVSIGEKVDDRW